MIPLVVVQKEAREIRIGDVLVTGDAEYLALEEVLTCFRQRDWRYRIVCDQSRVLWCDGDTYRAEGEDDRNWAYRPEHVFKVVA